MDRGTNSWRSGTATWAGTPPAASCCWADGGPTPGGKQSCCQLTPAPGNFAFNMKQCKEILKKEVFVKNLVLESRGHVKNFQLFFFPLPEIQNAILVC